MAKARPLSTRQLAVIDDICEGKKDQEILKKHNVDRKLYDKWLADESFNRRLNMRIEWEFRLNEIILARQVREAMTNLLDLTKSEQAETARKACIDIITMRDNLQANKSSDNPAALPADDPKLLAESANLCPETAGKILAALAE